MKIAMISNSLQGGIWNHSLNLCKALENCGHDLEIISRRSPHRDLSHHKARAIRIYFYEYFYRKSGIISKLRWMRPDVIHTHHQLGNLDFYLQKIKRLGRPMVSTIHVTPGQESRIDRFVRYYLKRMKKSLACSDRLICVSDFIRQSMERQGFSNLDVIHNGVDTGFFHQDKDARKALGFEGDDLLLLFVGRLSYEKGITKLLKACKGLEGVRLNIIGSGPLSALCHYYSMRNKNIRYIGKVSDMALRRHFSAADLTVFPSTWQEPFGMVLIESMACGTPVLAYKVGGVPEIVNSKNGRLIEERTSMALRKVIEEVRDSPFPKGTPRYCMDYVRSGFSWDIVARQTERVYREVS
jgi:glycosyltransferase involved in cell wall biosynthesis